MIAISSKFKFFPIFLIGFISFPPLLVLYVTFNSTESDRTGPVVLLLLVVLFWMTVLRTRANKVSIDGEFLRVRCYFGLGKTKGYDCNQLDGFITVFESGRMGVSENLFILEKGKRVGCVSDFYHSNFDQLKVVLKERTNDLGERKKYRAKEE
jgi:hypothetical protein